MVKSEEVMDKESIRK